MTKLLKRIFQILATLIIIVVLAVIGIINFVNPNQFKGVIEREVLAKTGFVLTVEGPIQWRWFPMLSLEFNNIAIQNPSPFTGQLLSAKTMHAECKFLPILLGKAAIAINIKEMDLALIRNAKGQTNWESVQKQINQQKAQTTQTQIVASANDANKQDSTKPSVTAKNTSLDKSTATKNTEIKKAPSASIPAVTISSIKVQDGTITFKDTSKNSEYALNHVNLLADNLPKALTGTLTSLALSFELTSRQQALANIFLNTDWALKEEKEQLNLQKIALKFKLPDGTTNVITGNTEVQGFSGTPTIKGNLSSNALQFGKIKIDTLKAGLSAQEGIFNFAPIDIHIAKSQHKATLKLDTNGNTPKIYLTQEAHNFEINDLLALFDKQGKLSGKTNLSMNLSATGSDLATLQNSLSGQANIAINQGKFHGIDLVTLLKNAQSSIHTLATALTQKLNTNSLSVINTELAKWKMDPKSNAFTPFNVLTATAKINNGMIINNPNLAINHAEYGVNGAGTINLNANTIQYQTTLQLKNNPYPETDKIGTFIFQTPLQVQILGSLDNPKITPDLKSYTNSALSFAQKQLVEKAIDKTVDKALGNVPGGEAVKDTLQKALGNILAPKH